MNLELLKALGPWVAAVVGLLVCLLNIINGRLTAAEDAHAKVAVYSSIWEWTSTLLFIAGCAMTSFGQFYLTACAFFAVAFAIQTVLFLLKKHTVTRAEVVVFSLQTGMVFSIIVMALIFSLLTKIVTLQQDMIGTQLKLLHVPGDKANP